MSEEIETVEVPAVPAKTVQRKIRVCDLCGKKNKAGQDSTWNHDGYTRDRVEITIMHEARYDHGGTNEGVAFDCCPECFTEKVAPALQAIGLQAREVDESF